MTGLAAVLAEPLLLKHYVDRRGRLGESHPTTIASMKALINLYDAWGRPQEAEKWRTRFPQAQTAK